MSNILITGFGAFLSHETNPAEKVAWALEKENHETVILPVSYARAKETLTKTLAHRNFDVILSLGLAAGRDHLSLETQAYNEMNSAHFDNDRVRKLGETIVPDGKAVLKTPFAVSALQKALEKKTFPRMSPWIRAATSATKSIASI